MSDFTAADKYWATEDPITLVSKLESKVDNFDKHLDITGRFLTARDVYYNYYLVNEQTYLFPNYGADGFKRLNINHFRAIIKHLLSLVTAQRATPEPLATNDDYKSQAQVAFCKNVLKSVEKEKHLEDHFELATETALLLSCSYVAREWDASLGAVYGIDPDSQAPLHNGDISVGVYNPLDVIFDFASSSFEELDWIVLRRYYNRWNLIAKFPMYADELKSISVDPKVKRHRLGHVLNEENDDIIPLYTFYHKKSPILPNGRATLFVSAQCCLFDGDLPYKNIPVSRIAADKQINSPFAYSVSFDLLPIQKVYNALCSTICTNQAAFGVQNILVPREAAIALTQLTEGLNAIYYDPSITQGAKPEALDLLSTPQEIFKWIEYLENMMAKISGVNETIQGDPAANLKSGTALAFVAAQAMTFISPLSRSYNQLLEDTWTGIIDILKQFATTPRMILISGIANRSLAKQFTAKDISDIDRVIVQAGNPLTNTLAGRIQIAQDLVNAGVLNKEEYLTVIQTGELEPLYAYERSELLTIKQENEDLQNGKQCKIGNWDNHPLHIREHFSLLSDPEARRTPNNPMMLNIMAHINNHLAAWRQIDPAIAALQNIPPCPPPLQAPNAMPQGVAPTNTPPNPGQPSPGAPAAPKGPTPNPTGSNVPQAPGGAGIKPPVGPKLPQGTPPITQAGLQALQAGQQPH